MAYPELYIYVLLVSATLGISQLFLGLMIGRWLWRERPASPSPGASREIRDSIYRLYTLASTVAENLDEHASRVESIHRELERVDASSDEPMGSVVLGFAAQIMQANERLQARLEIAEQRLHMQSKQIQTHLTDARTDQLTQVLNRRAFDDELRGALAKWREHNVPVCLMLLDVDHFKRLNDEHGHPVGDQVLRCLARVLCANTRESDLLCRYGGEEFALIVRNVELKTAVSLAERARVAVERRVIGIDAGTVRCTITAGVAQAQVDEDSASLLQRVDEALYAAKGEGRNCCFVHDGDKVERIERPTTQPVVPDDKPLPCEEELSEEEQKRQLSESGLAMACSDLRRQLGELVGSGSDER